MQLLRQSTAKIFRIGPFVDETDGHTAEVALVIAQADIQISKSGGAFAQTSNAAPTTTHDADGWYQCPLTTTDTNTLGLLTVQIAMAGALPVWKDFLVVTANVYDSLVSGTDYLDVEAAAIAAGAVGAAAIDTDAIDADALAADAVAEIAAAVAAADPAAVWAYATRTLTSSASATVAATTGDDQEITIAAAYADTISGLTIPATWTAMYWTVKVSSDDADTASILQVLESNPGGAADGVLYVEGAAATIAQQAMGSLTVNQVAGTVAIALQAALTNALSERYGLEYDIKVIDAGEAQPPLVQGAANVRYTPTRAI